MSKVGKNKKQKNKEGAEIMSAEEQNVTEVNNEDINEEVSEDNTQAPETVEDEPVSVAVEVDEFEEYPDVKGDEELIELRNLIKDYVDAVRDPNTENFTHKNTMLFIKMCKYVIRKDKVKLVEYLFEGLIKGHTGDLINGQTVFMFMEKVNDGDKAKVETLYTSLKALYDYLIRPKKFGFPLDIETIKKVYGGDSLSNFIKKKTN